jgi:hypothetical protein
MVLLLPKQRSVMIEVLGGTYLPSAAKRAR